MSQLFKGLAESFVLLKSVVGPTGFTRRKEWVQDGLTRRSKEEYNFSLDNDCRAKVPADYWEEIKDALFDKERSWRYRDVFVEL